MYTNTFYCMYDVFGQTFVHYVLNLDKLRAFLRGFPYPFAESVGVTNAPKLTLYNPYFN